MSCQATSRYKLLQKIAAGGMGVVYKAHDTRLNRPVVIKFLYAEALQDPARRARFMREARTASALDHPNICTIYDIDEYGDGQPFLVMAYCEGESLAQRLRRCGRLPLNEALRIACQLLEGLASAHDAGIVHRDIKPGNLMITGRNQVKIVDFGLAKLQGEPDDLSDPGKLLGTVAYAAPEQIKGFEVDARGDLWATGIVVYEMLAGSPPFVGGSIPALIHCILHDKFRPLSQVRPEIPPTLDTITRRALQKDRSQRYQNAREFLLDLERVAPLSSDAPTVSVSTGGETATVARSIVVLPFATVSSEEDAAHFSDGLTDEIIADLSAVGALRVICSTSAKRLKAKSDIRNLAKEAAALYVLEGTVRKSGNNIRVTTKVVDPASNVLVWAGKYGGNLEDLFTIQEAISRQVVGALKVKLSAAEDEKIREKPISDIRAYEYYLRAKREMLTYSREGLERALEYLQNGERIVGENILLKSAMGQVYWQFVNAGISSDLAYLEKAKACAYRILTLDRNSAHGNRLLGLISAHEGKTQEAVKLLKWALAADANDPDTLAWLVAVCGFSGKPAAAEAWCRKLLEIDPLTPSYQYLPGLLSLMAGDFSHAIAPFEKARKMEPDNPQTLLCCGQVHALNQHREEAVRIFDELAAAMPDTFFAGMSQLYRHAILGNKDEAFAHMTEDLKNSAGADLYYCWNVGECCALLGEKSEACTWIERAVQKGFVNFPLLSQMDPFLEGLRDYSCFVALMEKSRELWESFEI